MLKYRCSHTNRPDGCFFMKQEGKGANQALAPDDTAASDTFNGALAVALSEGKTFEESIVFANKAAAISVTPMEAQASIPYKNEL